MNRWPVALASGQYPGVEAGRTQLALVGYQLRAECTMVPPVDSVSLTLNSPTEQAFPPGCSSRWSGLGNHEGKRGLCTR